MVDAWKEGQQILSRQKSFLGKPEKLTDPWSHGGREEPSWTAARPAHPTLPFLCSRSCLILLVSLFVSFDSFHVSRRLSCNCQCIYFFQKQVVGAGKLAQRRALAVLPPTGLEFSSQHLRWAAAELLPVAMASGDLMPSSGFHEYCIHPQYHVCPQTQK